MGLALMLSEVASAQPVEPRPYDVRWSVDLPLLGALAAAWGLPSLLLDDEVDSRCPCDPGGVNALDRFATEWDSPSLSRASDVLLGAGLAAGLALDGWDAARTGGGWRGFAEDFVVVGEALAAGGVFFQIAVHAQERPRPYIYARATTDPVLRRATSYQSFFSGHTAAAFAGSLGLARTFALRHPHSRARTTIYALAASWGAAQAALRVASGRHFPTDVLAGAAVGTAMGLLSPWLHRRGSTTSWMLVPQAQGALVLLGGRL